MKTVEIKNEKIWLNNELVFQKEDSSFVPFIKGAYKHFDLSYPKFHKMDRLCKLAFVAAEMLLQENDLNGYLPEDIAIVMANANSTLHTDSKHCKSIQERDNYYPSPAVFVYTLPNIMVGEIAIKHKIKGESVFFIQQEPNMNFLLDYAKGLLQDKLAKICLIGWADYTEKDYYAILQLIK